ncbi:hypothetical protein ACH42_05195 [Endozoicomonas sp. (ex Bugula neritina AB1)]|nr:hypothetical protein ACH42_05195 [Endozoicomonas sp. (ex Bugula neritina AB1)]
MAGWLLALIALIYVGGLFFVAWYGDYKGSQLRQRWQPVIYSLSLAVYCTSWSFFGAVGQAQRDLWSFIPIYLGPILVFVLFWKLLVKMILVSKQENITSVADFIASRHGRSPALAIMVTLVLVVGVLPYIALQLKGIVMGFDFLMKDQAGRWSVQDLALSVTLTLAVFVIMFGTRRLDTTEHQYGVMTAIAFESLIKLCVFLVVGGWVSWMALDEQVVATTFRQMSVRFSGNWMDAVVIPTLMAMAAIICLPRQFHVMVVENASLKDFHRARWVFPGYLLLAAIFVLPLAIAGQHLLGSSVSPDMYVIALPKALGSNHMAVLAYLGGVSAAISMVIVATIALSTMISNEIVMPLILRRSREKNRDFYRFSGLLLNVRRTTILCLLLMAYVVYRLLDQSGTLAGIGQMSFSAVSQLLPVFIGSLYLRDSNRMAAFMGLSAGLFTWFICLVVPVLVDGGWVDSSVLSSGFLGINGLRPDDLFGVGITDSKPGATLMALSLNVIFYVLGCLYFRPNWEEKRQAQKFVDASLADQDTYHTISITMAELEALAGRFLDKSRIQAVMHDFHHDQLSHRHAFSRQRRASHELVEAIERLLAGTMGASSARIVMRSMVNGQGLQLDDVQAMVDEASEVFEFNRELLQGAIEHIDIGISVINRELKLVAWNPQYLKLFNYPDGLICIGRPIADVIQHNAIQGLCGPGLTEEHVRKRMSYMQQGTAHQSERVRPDGRVIQMRGNPMPGGGFVMSFTDITGFRQVEQALKDVNESLERRVQERTKELSVLNMQLLRAKSQAEQANKMRLKFFAAISHDLMQPMNAAKLFASSLELLAKDGGEDEELKMLARNVSGSLQSAEDLLVDLLDMSRLEAGKITASIRDMPLTEVLKPLNDQFSYMAKELLVDFRLQESDCWVRSDPILLRRVVQNFLTNAFRYGLRGAEHGRILVCCRRSGSDHIRIEVRDNGPGIPKQQQELIFAEFQRLSTDSQGLGLGLSIAMGIADILGHTIALQSGPNKGTTFSVCLPLAERKTVDTRQHNLSPSTKLNGLSILCIDNEPDILRGMDMLLNRWGCRVSCALNSEEAMEVLNREGSFDLLLVDYRLDESVNGLELIGMIRDKANHYFSAALVTADNHDELRAQCRELKVGFLVKPVKPASMRAYINSVLARTESKHDRGVL